MTNVEVKENHSPLSMEYGPKGPVGASQQRLMRGGSIRRSKPSAFNIPFLT